MGFGMSGAIRRCFLAVDVWIHSKVASCGVLGGRSETVTWFPAGFFPFPLPIMIAPLLHIHVTTL